MSIDFFYFVHQYGYLAIFIFIFLQEVGAPNPLPNEFVLLFSGYMVFSNVFFLPFILMVIILADLLAASILYISFYFFGSFILNKEHRWVPIPQETIVKQSKRIQERGWSGIAIGRITPFVRGYVAVICGLLHVQPKKYGFTILVTSSIWACFYISFGYILGPYWNDVMADLQLLKLTLGGIMVVVVSVFVIRMILSKRKKGVMEKEH